MQRWDGGCDHDNLKEKEKGISRPSSRGNQTIAAMVLFITLNYFESGLYFSASSRGPFAPEVFTSWVGEGPFGKVYWMREVPHIFMLQLETPTSKKKSQEDQV